MEYDDKELTTVGSPLSVDVETPTMDVTVLDWLDRAVDGDIDDGETLKDCDVVHDVHERV